VTGTLRTITTVFGERGENRTTDDFFSAKKSPDAPLDRDRIAASAEEDFAPQRV